MLGPNIIGWVDGFLGLSGVQNGVFSLDNLSKGNTPSSHNNAYHELAFDANLASSIYKNNVKTVQPSSLVLNHIIKY